MKRFLILLIFITMDNIYAESQQTFDYITSLQTYWNYRYHLVGDKVCRNQYMPWDPMNWDPNLPNTGIPFLNEIGEPGMLVIGQHPGMSVPAHTIQLYGVPYGPPIYYWITSPQGDHWTGICPNVVTDPSCEDPTYQNPGYTGPVYAPQWGLDPNKNTCQKQIYSQPCLPFSDTCVPGTRLIHLVKLCFGFDFPLVF